MKMIMAWLTVSLGALGAEVPSLQLDLGNGVKMELIRVEPGTFTEGSPESEAGRGADETQRTITISQPYYLARFPVTYRQWEAFAKDSSYKTEAEKGQSGGYGWDGTALRQAKEYTWRFPGFAQAETHPVTLVTWFDAQEYLKWLSRKTGRVCKLPSEAQWEYACRAGSSTAWPTGDDELAANVWSWNSGNAAGRTYPVGKKQANAWGFQDMGGQVWEWCQDWYAPYEAGPATDPLQTNDKLSDKPRRVLRGGSFIKSANFARSAARYRNDPRSRNADNGFRVMVLVTDQAAAPVHQDVAPQTSDVPSVPAEMQGRALDFPPIHESFPPQIHRSRGFGFFPILIGVGVILILIVKFLKRKAYTTTKVGNQTMPLIPSATRLTVQLGNDGFWVKGNLRGGSAFVWKCVVNGEVREGTATYEPGPDGMLIYTGARPDRAEAWPADQGYGSSSDTYPNQEREENFTRGAAMGMMYDRLHRDSDHSSPPPLPRSSYGSSRSSFPSAY